MLARKKSNEKEINEEKIVNEIRALGLDMIAEAKSGHPGIVLGAAPILYTLYAHHLRFSLSDLDFYNRDRFVMSSGHGSALLYATLCMAGFGLELDDLKKFRSLHSLTPGHPEYGVTPGVEMTSGPLGQGFASAVGMAIAEKHSAALLNKDKKTIIDYNIYCLCGDGDLMEGISYEAASLAGTLELDNLIVLYDSNHVCLDGDTSFVFCDQMESRFTAMNWDYFSATDEIASIDKAIEKAKSSHKPALIEVKTTIGKYSCYAGQNIVHGKPLTEEEITDVKNALGVRDIPFTITSEALEDFQTLILERNQDLVSSWQEVVASLKEEDQALLQALKSKNKKIALINMNYEQPLNKMESLRSSSSKMLNSYAISSDLVLGGAADVASSTLTTIMDSPVFEKRHYEGRNIMFGVREHAMAAIANGLALSGYRPFVSTYLSFSDYLKPALRLSCLMNLPVVYIFTHDSISLGQDGPTHQPVEQLVSLRATPNLEVFRPADSNEVIGSYKAIFEQDHPACLILGRNTVPILDTTSVPKVADGAYIVRKEERKLDGIILSSGEEVSLALDIIALLQEKGYDLRLVSMPSLERFKQLPKQSQEELLPVGIKKFVIEKSSAYSWHDFTYSDAYLFTQDQFGASGSKTEVNQEFGFTKEALSLEIEELLK